jgi:hypothetical protein
MDSPRSWVPLAGWPSPSPARGSALVIGVSHSTVRWCVVSTPYETFRATVLAITPDGHRATVIITRQGWGSEGRVWVTFSGGWVTTAVLTNEEADHFMQLVSDARNAKMPRW